MPRHSFVYQRNRPDLTPGGPVVGSADRLLNIDQVRRRLNCSKSHVYNLINTGELPAVTLGASKGKRVYAADVYRYLADRGESEGADPDVDEKTGGDPAGSGEE